MKVSLLPTVEYINEQELKDKVVIVIDVLRATSVITTAIGNGASEVVVTIEIDEAMNLKDDKSLLGGERKALMIEGFDLSNSPLEYRKEIVKGKRIVLTTTNGTKAIYKSMAAKKIYIGSMLNGRAVAQKAAAERMDVVIACAGTYGKFSIDDFICAGKIISDISNMAEAELDDFAAASYMAYRDNRGDIEGYVKMASHYKYLISIGLKGDIKYCLTEDLLDVVPEYKNGKIRASE
jgi:2-phosphosulfolactate phosphatase